MNGMDGSYHVRMLSREVAGQESDFLQGANAIALFLFGDSRRTRKVYYLAESGQLPVFKLGGLCARRSTLRAWLSDHEQSGRRQSDKRPS